MTKCLDLFQDSTSITKPSTSSDSQNKTSAPTLRPIAPSPTKPGPGSSAELVLRLPDGGGSVHLSSLPFVKSVPKAPDLPLPTSKPRAARKRPATDADALAAKKDELLERNRVAAARSRQKKKREKQEMETTASALKTENNKLSVENEVLRGEVQRLKGLLKPHVDCPVARELGQTETIRSELHPKIVCYNTERAAAHAQKDLLQKATEAILTPRVTAAMTQEVEQQAKRRRTVEEEAEEAVTTHLSVKQKIRNNMRKQGRGDQ